MRRNCGTLVASLTPDGDRVFLPAGSMDGDPERRVDKHRFVGSKASWFEITDDEPQRMGETSGLRGIRAESSLAGP
jgi:hypothetical protein